METFSRHRKARLRRLLRDAVPFDSFFRLCRLGAANESINPIGQLSAGLDDQLSESAALKEIGAAQSALPIPSRPRRHAPPFATLGYTSEIQHWHSLGGKIARRREPPRRLNLRVGQPIGDDAHRCGSVRHDRGLLRRDFNQRTDRARGNLYAEKIPD